jgi:DNA-binding MarR family transcriptional regulator
LFFAPADKVGAGAEAEGAAKEKGASKPVSADAFANAVSAMSRFLAMLAGSPVFKESSKDKNLGLADWLSLHSIAMDNKGTTVRQLSRALGITTERQQQIIATLVAAGVVTLREEDGKRKYVASPSGEQCILEMNASLDALLATSKARSVSRMGRNLRGLSRSFAGSGEGKSKKGKKGKKKGKAGETSTENDAG